MGDRILAVDGVDMSNATHQEAVLALLQPPHQIRLTVRHDPQPRGLMVSAMVSSLHSGRNTEFKVAQC
jgi:protein scribble